ncbi:hypothetical protein Dimus_026277 [Dionaea muscipula]
MAALQSYCYSPSSSTDFPRRSTMFGSSKNFVVKEEIHLESLTSLRTDSSLRLKAMAENVVSKEETEVKLENGSDLFIDMRSRFLSFKRDTYLRNLERFENLAKSQTPKFMVIACADSRVCPSTILGFKPGEAFMLRNVANLVPPFEKGPSETNAALEFAVNSLEVENVLVIGHSCCGGIQALMSMEDEGDSRSFIRSWVLVGKKARANTKAAVPNLHFEQQCQHCEKESVNCSLENLLTYPWIEERVAKGVLSLHGGYYNFVDCTFEKWTLDYRKGSLKEDGPRYHITNQEYWC